MRNWLLGLSPCAAPRGSTGRQGWRDRELVVAAQVNGDVRCTPM